MDISTYDTDLDKLALAVESSKQAKQLTVEEEGIGEDLNINLFCWKGKHLVVIAQIVNTHLISKNARLRVLADGCAIIRKGWGVDSITLVAEGYCSFRPSDTKGQDLPMLFSQPDSPVTECLTLTHIGEDGSTFISVPYRTTVGRQVEFDDALWYEGLDVMRDMDYPSMLEKVLEMPYTKPPRMADKSVFYATLCNGLVESGLEVFFRDDM